MKVGIFLKFSNIGWLNFSCWRVCFNDVKFVSSNDYWLHICTKLFKERTYFRYRAFVCQINHDYCCICTSIKCKSERLKPWLSSEIPNLSLTDITILTSYRMIKKISTNCWNMFFWKLSLNEISNKLTFSNFCIPNQNN